MDYEKEVSGMKNRRDFWKPTAGQWDVLIQSEPEPDKFIDSDGNVTEQIKMEILVKKKDSQNEGKEYLWTVGKGVTLSSLYGQLMLVGKSNGKLKDKTVELLVNFDGKKNSYTIPEALDLQTKEEKVLG